MLFNSFEYAVFFPIVIITHYLLPHRYRHWALLAASFWFYMSWDARLIVLIVANSAIHYCAARWMGALPRERRGLRKAIVAGGVGISLMILFFFKYFDFFSASFTSVVNKIGSLERDPVILHLVLPMGISFYTFQTLSYTIDVYRGDAPVEKNFAWLLLFVMFFPQLVAGPIERIDSLLPQLKKERPFHYDNMAGGLKRIAIGLFKKIVVADTLAKGVNLVYNDVRAYTGGSLMLATVLFAFQVYCDFSGYSDIATGSAKALGIDLMRNFKSPFLSRSIKEFWTRWHISLSTWFRDYVYIPLGGNRRGKLRKHINLIVMFLLSGLWHGASWTFILWGGAHALLQIVETALYRGKKVAAVKNPFQLRGIWKVPITFTLVTIPCILFRANTVSDALYVFRNMFSGLANPARYVRELLSSLDISKVGVALVAFEILVLLVIDILDYRADAVEKISALRLPARWIIYIGFVVMIVALSSKTTLETFIYFQF